MTHDANDTRNTHNGGSNVNPAERVNQLRRESARRSNARVRHPDFKPELKLTFLRCLRKGFSVTKACDEIGISPRAAYAHRSAFPQFAEQWDDAVEEGAHFLEDVAVSRAVDGYERPIYQGGVKVGTETVYNDNLLMFMLKGRIPEKYRERMDVTTDGKDIVQSFARALVELKNYGPSARKQIPKG